MNADFTELRKSRERTSVGEVEMKSCLRAVKKQEPPPGHQEALSTGGRMEGSGLELQM